MSVVNEYACRQIQQDNGVPSVIHHSIPVDDRMFEIGLPDAINAIFEDDFKALNTSEDVVATDYVKVASCSLPDIWMRLPQWLHQAEVVEVPTRVGEKTRTRMNGTGHAVVRKWHIGCANL